MRVACISTSLVPGITANSIQLMKVCQSLADLDHEVRLWVPALAEPRAWGELAEQYGLRSEFPIAWLPVLPWLRRYDFSWQAVRAAEAWRADLFYLWPLQAAALASRMGHPTLLEMHDLPAGRLGPWLFRQFLAGRGAARILVTTRGLLTGLAADDGGQQVRELAQLAPNGVDLARYRDLPAPEEARRELGLPAGFSAVYSGHLYPGRGAELMFRLAERNPGMAFIWAGGTEEANESWRRRVEAAGLANLHLLGFVPNARLPLVQAAGDVLLMPYGREIAVSGGGDSAAVASPMKVFEYLAAGRPILSSDLPVLREVIDEKNAILLPPEDEAAWGKALRRLQEHPAQRERLAEAARRTAQGYSWRGRTQRALEGVLARGSR